MAAPEDSTTAIPSSRMSVGGRCFVKGSSPGNTSWNRDKSGTAADSCAAGHSTHTHTHSPTFPLQVHGSYHIVTADTISEEPVYGLEESLDLQGSQGPHSYQKGMHIAFLRCPQKQRCGCRIKALDRWNQKPPGGMGWPPATQMNYCLSKVPDFLPMNQDDIMGISKWSVLISVCSI